MKTKKQNSNITRDVKGQKNSVAQPSNYSIKSSVLDKLYSSEFVAPFRVVERSFLQVLISNFTLTRFDGGVSLDVYFQDDTPAIWSRSGKRMLASTLHKNSNDKIELYQKKLEEFLIKGENKSFTFDDDNFYFRFLSGGVLPIVNIANKKYYCLIYRERQPVGWNIANGGSDRRDEILQPIKTIMREMNEELLIIDLDKQKRYVFGEVIDLPEFAIVREIMKNKLLNLNWDQLEIFFPEINWQKGPDRIVIKQGKGAKRKTHDCYININATDFGIEIDKIAHFEVGENAIFIDGELCEGNAPGYHIENAPIGLFEVMKLNKLITSGAIEYIPDFFFWTGKKYDGRRIEEIIREYFIPSMAKDMTEIDKNYFDLQKEHILDLCPVTLNIIRRSITLKKSS